MYIYIHCSRHCVCVLYVLDGMSILCDYQQFWQLSLPSCVVFPLQSYLRTRVVEKQLSVHKFPACVHTNIHDVEQYVD